MATTTPHPQRQDSAAYEKESIEQIERNPQHPAIIVDEKVHDPGLYLYPRTSFWMLTCFGCRRTVRCREGGRSAGSLVSSIFHDLRLRSHGLPVLHGKRI